MLAQFKFHHLGVAVFDIDDTAEYYVEAGYEKGNKVFDPIQNVYICFLTKEGMPTVELLAPKDESSPVCKILEKNGVSPYHSCYEVNDLDKTISDMKRQKYILVRKPESAIALGNRRVCFLFNKNVGLIELLEK